VKVLYLSPGNLPSKWAHTFQVVKMAEALAAQVERLELVTARSLLPSRINRIDLHGWYGVSPQLRIVRLPVHARLRGECFSHDASPRFDFVAAWYARLRRPDLVYSRSIPAAERCAASGLATIVESHIPVGHPQFAQLRAAADHTALRRLVTVSEVLREEWIAAGLPAAKISVWPDAVDLERFEHSPPLPAARDALRLPREGALAVYCGHFYDEKGVPTLVDAARLLRKATVQLVGGWPADIERMRERAQGCETLRCCGFVENARVPLHLAAADVLVLPNSARFPQARTTSPLKLFEYMAARRPIVATRIPALAGLLRHGENAWLVAPDSAEALAEGIESVLASPALAERLAEQAWRDVQNYTWKRRAADVLATLAAAGPGDARAGGAPRAPRSDVGS
jgi:glycosyltransferase involved in cell wall biosynthesis